MCGDVARGELKSRYAAVCLERLAGEGLVPKLHLG